MCTVIRLAFPGLQKASVVYAQYLPKRGLFRKSPSKIGCWGSLITEAYQNSVHGRGNQTMGLAVELGLGGD